MAFYFPIFSHLQRVLNLRKSLIISKAKSYTCALNLLPFCPLSELIHQHSISPLISGPDQLLYKYAIASKLTSQLPGFSSFCYFPALHQNYLSKKKKKSFYPINSNAQHFVQDLSQFVKILLALLPTMFYHPLGIMAIPCTEACNNRISTEGHIVSVILRVDTVYHFFRIHSANHPQAEYTQPTNIYFKPILCHSQSLPP